MVKKVEVKYDFNVIDVLRKFFNGKRKEFFNG